MIARGAAGRRCKGRLRDFVFASLDHFLSDDRARHNAVKRGGGVTRLSLNDPENSDALAAACLSHSEASLPCDRRWALGVVSGVFERLEADYTRRGHGELFRALKPHLTGEAVGSYRTLSRRLRRSSAALRKPLSECAPIFGKSCAGSLPVAPAIPVSKRSWPPLSRSCAKDKRRVLS